MDRGVRCFSCTKMTNELFNIIVAMIFNLGGTDRVNNFSTSLNVKLINTNNLNVMEKRAGSFVENMSEKSTKTDAKEYFKQEMKQVKLF